MTRSMTDQACNYCDRRDCPAIAHDQLSTEKKVDLMTRLAALRDKPSTSIAEGQAITAAVDVIRALEACRNNLREDFEVVHESIADLVNDGSAPPPICAWCTTNFSTYAAIRDHLLSCPKHPVVIVAEKRAAALRALLEIVASWLDDDELRARIADALRPAEMPKAPAD